MSEFETERNREIFFEQAAKKAVVKVWERFDLAEVIEHPEEQNEEDLQTLGYLIVEYLKTDLADLVNEAFAETDETFGLTIEDSGNILGQKIIAKIKESFQNSVESGEFTGDFADILETSFEDLS